MGHINERDGFFCFPEGELERKNKDSISVLGLPVEKQVFTKTKKVAVGRNRTGKFYFLCFGVRVMLLKREEL